MRSDLATEKFANSCVAFPFRLERGLLEKSDEREAYLTLLGIMAKTPRGSWSGHTGFGFNEFFLEFSRDGLSREQRARLADTAVSEINLMLADLGLTRFRVDSLTCESGENDHDVHGVQRWGRARQERAVTLMLRETGSDHATRFVL